MARVKVTIKQTQTAEFDAGDLPVELVRSVLLKNKGTFDGNYGLGDLDKDEAFAIDSITVERID